MGGERKKVQISIKGLPEPWMAYAHLAKKRVFYHNPNTNTSVWELPLKAKKKCRPGLQDILETELERILSSKDADCSLEMMDCSEWMEPANSPKDRCEAMDIDLTQDLRQMRGSQYDQGALPLHDESQQPFEAFPGTSRSCVVFDTCALIDDPDLISECISRHVFVVIPYRVYYELDRMKKISSRTESAAELRRIATTLTWILRELRQSPFIYWESSVESFSPVEGFMTSSEEDVNDDYILKCAFRIKTSLDARNADWEVVFITNDQLLSLKAHASSIPCYTVEETNAILAKVPVVSDEVQQDVKPIPDNNGATISSSCLENSEAVNHQLEKKERTSNNRSLTKFGNSIKAHLDNSIEVHKLKREKNRHLKVREKVDGSEMDSLKRFDRMWRPLLRAFYKRYETTSAKQKKDIHQLQEDISSFISNQDEATLIQVVKNVWWLYNYYYPQRDKKEDSYQDILHSGLLSQLCTPSTRSNSVMRSLRKFSNDSMFAHG